MTHWNPDSTRTIPRLAVAAGLFGLAFAGCGFDDPAGSSKGPAGALADGRLTRELETFWHGQMAPHEVAPGIYQAHGVGNTNLVVTKEGFVVIDGGLPTSAEDHRKLLSPVASGDARYVIATHAHADHAGGLSAWIGEDTIVVAHREFPESQRYLTSLVPFFMPRNKIYYPESVPDLPEVIAVPLFRQFYPHLEPTLLVDDTHRFELGGERFEVIHTPGAEGADSISVWLPDRKILFTGDFFGPIFPMWPNLYSIRGEKTRFALPYIESLNRVLDLAPEIIVPSHFLPVEGREKIREGVTRTRDAVQYVHDATVEGMNKGRDVYTLMKEIRLPPELELSEAHGKVSWGVRAIWEGYAGWFHHETPQLYAVPPQRIWPDVVALAGGPAAIAQLASERVAAGRPVEALHLSAMALAADPAHVPSLKARLAALEVLQQRSGGINHSETMWLKRQVEETQRILKD